MADLAYAQAAGGGAPGGGFSMLVPLVLMFLVFYFLLIRPQQRQKREREALLSAVKKGDRVVTTSGLHGIVVGLTEQTMTLKVADQVKLDFDRSALGRVVPAGAPKESGA